ncbi:MAG: CaiB/BaiF CoA transferase family protein [Acidimicrobiales bacterium]
MRALPLEGIRVLDMGVALAGPQGALFLADLGAEVIRIESTQHFPPLTRGPKARPTVELVRRLPTISGGYPDRDPGPRPWNRHPWFNLTARNKLSMTIDLERDPGPELFRRLVAISDVLITNQAPGKMERLGLSYDELRKVHPGLSYIEATSFGSSGPYKDFRAMGHQIEAFSGHDVLRHRRGDDVTSNSWVVAADAAGSVGIALGALMALQSRLRTGQGQFVDVSMVECFIGLLGHTVLDYTVNGHLQQSMGNRDFSALQGCYRCAGDDRWIVLTICDNADWAALCGGLGHEEFVDDARFRTVEARRQDAADSLIGAWVAGMDRDQLVETLRHHGVTAGPVLDDADATEDPHLRAREFFVEIDQPDSGRHAYPGFPYKFDHARLRVRRGPCQLGEHNEYVYKQLLDVSDEQYAALRAGGHVGTEYADHIQ